MTSTNLYSHEIPSQHQKVEWILYIDDVANFFIKLNIISQF